jgi:hypothetical protein
MDRRLDWVNSASKASLHSPKLGRVHNEVQMNATISGFVQLEEFGSSVPNWPMTGSPPLTLHHLMSNVT